MSRPLAPLRRRARRGLTLLEVVIALAIMAIMMAMAGAAISNSIEAKDLLAEKDETTRAARVAMGRLRREVQLAFLTPNTNAVNTYRTVFVGLDDSPDKLFFASQSHQRLYRDSRECDQTEISVWTEPASGRGRGYVLYHRESARIDHEPDEGGVIFPIAQNVRSFELRYLDNRTNEWRNDWDSRKNDYLNRLPRAVQIALVLISPDPEDPNRTVDVPFFTTVRMQYAERLIRRAGT